MARPKQLSFVLGALAAALLLGGCARPQQSQPSSQESVPTAMNAPLPTPTGIAAGTTRRDAFGIEQVWVPAGEFTMGSSEVPQEKRPRWADFSSEQPAHTVQITRGYWLDAYEVTNAAFDAFVAAGGYREKELWSENGWQWLSQQNIERLPQSCLRQKPGPQDPRVCMTWYEAEAYARWRGGRLPTEAEWEYAARGPKGTIFPWGNTFDTDKLNMVHSKGPVPVGSFPGGRSWVGAYDMAGNAMEWVQDWYDAAYYQRDIRVDPQGPDTGTTKVKKGGWWGGPTWVARCAYRHEVDPPTYQDHHIGFRIVSPQ